ncbi:hypothetical protein SLS58_001691 [Diplodia intermedia]|uniref:Uncharacterized protein n=1 Tax=Diplodia intermedia TaxID=856260 RepID=A0ABR3U0P0_9PEZI
MSGPARSDQQERHAAAVVVDTKKRPAEEQDEPPTANNNQEQESSAAVDPNQPASYRCYDQPQSPLFGKLPAELRLMVWEHALTPASAAIDRPAVAVGLLETCWRAYDETKLLVYERNQVRAHLLQSPLPGDAKVHWTRLLSAEQQARTHLNLYVQPGASSAWGWNLLRWTKKAGFQPATLQLTVWFTSGGNWWRHYVDDMFKSVRAMRGVRRYVFELRTERDRFAEFDKRVRELRARRIALADGSVLVGDGRPTEYFEGSRVMMDNVFGRPTRLSEEQQPRWIPCQDPEKDAEREMLATVLRWEVESDGSSSLSSA